jgi:hypothetical protein
VAHEYEVFGVASNECLSYAMDNKAEWAAKGRQVVHEMAEANSADDNSWKPEDSLEGSMSITELRPMNPRASRLTTDEECYYVTGTPVACCRLPPVSLCVS